MRSRLAWPQALSRTSYYHLSRCQGRQSMTVQPRLRQCNHEHCRKLSARERSLFHQWEAGCILKTSRAFSEHLFTETTVGWNGTPTDLHLAEAIPMIPLHALMILTFEACSDLRASLSTRSGSCRARLDRTDLSQARAKLLCCPGQLPTFRSNGSGRLSAWRAIGFT